MLGIVNENHSVFNNALINDKEDFNMSGFINALNAKLISICNLLALLEAHHILHITRIRVNKQNMRYRIPVNCREQQEEPLCSPKMPVCL